MDYKSFEPIIVNTLDPWPDKIQSHPKYSTQIFRHYHVCSILNWPSARWTYPEFWTKQEVLDITMGQSDYEPDPQILPMTYWVDYDSKDFILFNPNISYQKLSVFCSSLFL